MQKVTFFSMSWKEEGCRQTLICLILVLISLSSCSHGSVLPQTRPNSSKVLKIYLRGNATTQNYGGLNKRSTGDVQFGRLIVGRTTHQEKTVFPKMWMVNNSLDDDADYQLDIGMYVW